MDLMLSEARSLLKRFTTQVLAAHYIYYEYERVSSVVQGKRYIGLRRTLAIQKEVDRHLENIEDKWPSAMEF